MWGHAGGQIKGAFCHLNVFQSVLTQVSTLSYQLYLSLFVSSRHYAQLKCLSGSSTFCLYYSNCFLFKFYDFNEVLLVCGSTFLLGLVLLFMAHISHPSIPHSPLNRLQSSSSSVIS